MTYLLSVFENIPIEKNVCFGSLGWNVLYISIMSTDAVLCSVPKYHFEFFVCKIHLLLTAGC